MWGKRFQVPDKSICMEHILTRPGALRVSTDFYGRFGLVCLVVEVDGFGHTMLVSKAAVQQLAALGLTTTPVTATELAALNTAAAATFPADVAMLPNGSTVARNARLRAHSYQLLLVPHWLMDSLSEEQLGSYFAYHLSPLLLIFAQKALEKAKAGPRAEVKAGTAAALRLVHEARQAGLRKFPFVSY